MRTSQSLWYDDSMARSSNKRKSNQAARRRLTSPEPSAVEFMIVGWLMSVFTTLVCILIGVASLASEKVWPNQPGLALLSGFILFAGFIMGIFSIILMIVVVRTRNPSPPQALIRATVVVAMIPPLLLSLRAAQWL